MASLAVGPATFDGARAPVVVLTETVAVPVLTPRFVLLDASRGLFLFWMIVAHALGLAAVNRDSVLAYLVPPAGSWLSERFVVLSGFTVAWVFGERILRPGASGWKLYRRGLQIGSIAFLSNLVSRLIVDAVEGCLTRASVFETVTLQREWSISWILLPTTLLLLVSPWILRLGRLVGPLRLLALTTIGGLLVHGWLQGPLIAWSLSTRAAGVHLDPASLVTILTLGLWGLALALWARRFDLTWFVTGLAVTCVGLMSIDALWPLPGFVSAVSRFGVFFGVGLLVTVLPLPGQLARALALLGRNALLVFVSHRLLMQLECRLLGQLVSPSALALLMTATVLAGMLICCHVRESLPPRLAAAVKAVGF